MNTAPEVREFVLAELEMAEYNPRDISEEAAARLTASIDAFGLLALPVVNVSEGKQLLVSGHQRVTQLIKEGYTCADCVVVNFDLATEIAANLTLNNTAIQGTYDTVQSQQLLKRVAKSRSVPKGIGLEQLQARMQKKAESAAQREITAERVAQKEADTATQTIDSQVGKVYAVGAHRIYCGDFADGADILFQTEKAAASVGDPPYGVQYVAREGIGKNEQLTNDELQGVELEKFFCSYCAIVQRVTKGVCYVFMGQKQLHVFSRCWTGAGGYIMRWLFWVKSAPNVPFFSYRNKYEAIMFGAPRGITTSHVVSGQNNVLAFGTAPTRNAHATPKSVEVVGKLISESTAPHEIVFDPCLGSGTTLIACEETSRVCYACELEPKHVDAARRRWVDSYGDADVDWRSQTLST